MAINRYSRPIQAQYIPTQPTPQLQMMMLQKRAADEARLQQEQSILENELLKTKAYGQEDAERLKERQSFYQGQISNMYDKYQNNPNAMLQEMNVLRRNFDKDRLAGDLYDINRNYTISQEDIKDAKERFGKGDISQYGLQAQIGRAGSGFRAPKYEDPLKEFEGLIAAADYSTDVFEGDEEAAFAHAMNIFTGISEKEMSMMPPEARANLTQRAASVFWNKYRNDQAKSKSFKGDPYTFSNTFANPIPALGDVSIADINFNEDGSINRTDHVENARYTIGNSPRSGFGFIGSGGGADQGAMEHAALKANERRDKHIKAISDFREQTGLSKDLTEKEVSEKYTEYYKSRVASYSRPFKSRENSKIRSLIPKLHNSKTKSSIPTLSGEVYVDGELITQGTINNVIAEKLGLNPVEDAAAINAAKESAVGFINPSGNTPGAISYEMSDKDGNSFVIEVQNPDEKIQKIFTPSNTLVRAINSGQISGNVSGVFGNVVKKDGTEEFYGSVNIETKEDENGNMQETIYAVNKDGEIIKDSDGKPFKLSLEDDIMEAELLVAEDYLVDYIK